MIALRSFAQVLRIMICMFVRKMCHAHVREHICEPANDGVHVICATTCLCVTHGGLYLPERLSVSCTHVYTKATRKHDHARDTCGNRSTDSVRSQFWAIGEVSEVPKLGGQSPIAFEVQATSFDINHRICVRKCMCVCVLSVGLPRLCIHVG